MSDSSLLCAACAAGTLGSSDTGRPRGWRRSPRRHVRHELGGAQTSTLPRIRGLYAGGSCVDDWIVAAPDPWWVVHTHARNEKQIAQALRSGCVLLSAARERAAHVRQVQGDLPGAAVPRLSVPERRARRM